MITPPLNTKQMSWFKKFAVTVGVVVCTLIAIVGGISAIGGLVITLDEQFRQQKTIGIVVSVIILAFSGGMAWLAVYLNRSLKKPSDRGTLRFEKGRPVLGINPFICQHCAMEVPTIKAAIYSHVGAIVLMFHRSIRGYLCKNCISSYFWKWTILTFFVGWWGLISLLITPIVLMSNFVMYVRSLFMPPAVAKGAAPSLTEQEFALIQPMQAHIEERLSAGEDPSAVSNAIATATGVTPAQAYLFIGGVVANSGNPLL